MSYGIHHCENVVIHRADWANGVLLRAVAIPGEPERVVAGPALLARRFGIDRGQGAQPVHLDRGLWIAPRPSALSQLKQAGLVHVPRMASARSRNCPGAGTCAPAGAPRAIRTPGVSRPSPPQRGTADKILVTLA